MVSVLSYLICIYIIISSNSSQFDPTGTTHAPFTVLMLMMHPQDVMLYLWVPAIDLAMYWWESYRSKEMSKYMSKEESKLRPPVLAFTGVVLGTLFWRYGLKKVRYPNLHVGPHKTFTCTPDRSQILKDRGR